MVVSFDVDLYYTIGVLTLRLNGCSVTNFHCESGVDFDSPYRYSLRPNARCVHFTQRIRFKRTWSI